MNKRNTHKRRSSESRIRNELLAGMAAAYREHLDEAATNPAIRRETWDDFFSPYYPAPDDDALIANVARRASGVAQDASEEESGDLSR